MWNISLILVPVFLCLLVFHIIYGESGWETSSLATAVAAMNLVWMRFTRKYLIVAIVSVVAGIIIAQASVFLIPDSHMITDVMWSLLVSVFGYFLLGSLIGFIILMINVTGILLFLMNGSQHDVLQKGINIEELNSGLIFNAYFVALAFAFIIHRMIVNIKEGNARYEEQIARNEILLKEIHHRVKNNLQIISSLLKLQAAESGNARAEEDFSEAISRIRSMALIHEKMYTNDDLSQINIQSYLIALVEDITGTIQSSCNIEVEVNSEMDKIDIKSIVPVSLIFNELITNSIKHGFSGSKSGKINVRIEHSDQSVAFHYHDDGLWKAPSSDSTFGLELIKTLTDQLEGSYETSHSEGTAYHFKFPAGRFFLKD